MSVSSDGRKWRDVLKGQSSGKSARAEPYAFNAVESFRYVKTTCYGNTSDLWNSVTEVES